MKPNQRQQRVTWKVSLIHQQQVSPFRHLCQREVCTKIGLIGFLEIKKIAMAPVSGSEPRIHQVNAFVDRMFQDSLKNQKHVQPPMYSTMNDRFYMDPVITDAQLRKNHFEELQAETRANDAQVLKTNVRIGSYNGWKPK